MNGSLNYSFIDEKKENTINKNKTRNDKQRKNVTIKKRTPQNFLNNMKKIFQNDDDDEDDLDNFKPMVEKEEEDKEKINNLKNNNDEDDDKEVSMESFNKIASDNASVKNYMEAFTKMGGQAINDNTVPSVDDVNQIKTQNVNDITDGYVTSYVPYYTRLNNSKNLQGNEDNLMKKLNYMIHLLEEQQDQKTENVTEELVLYSFLGIFVIFVVDGFARAGKYTR
tara:strand:+ start:364 stop:1035 length:672 start_codon:yes stop_codon:yes gene_type:complete